MSILFDDSARLTEWLSTLSYQDVRNVESLQPARLPNGSRLRGILITPDLCLGRNRQFYDVSTPQAIPLTTEQVLMRYRFPHLVHLFKHARAQIWRQRSPYRLPACG